MWKDPGTPADSFYEVRPECSDVPKTRFKIKAGKTLSARKWHAAFTPEGRLDISKTLSRIQRGGVHPSIRGEVWEFLLGCYDPKSTFDDRDAIRQRRRMQYSIWKEDCKQMDSVVGSGRIITAPLITEDGVPIQDPLNLLEAYPSKGLASAPEADGDTSDSEISCENESNNGASSSTYNTPEEVKGENSHVPNEATSHVPLDKKVIQWKLTLHQIGLDVVRTDRTLVFYEKQENLSKLWDILAVYAWIDKDVGYCQGMSDLCSPMIILLEDEADAFWCFERLMRRLRANFRCTESSVGVETQLSNLASITQVLDPKLHQHLETLGGGDYLFAFRMLMVLFRREFSFGDSLFLWEMMWALEYDPDLFELYEEPDLASQKGEGSKGKVKSIRQCGKFERENMRSGSEAPLPISVFLVASVLKTKSSKLMQEARGLDDVVKILNDITGNLDAKKACSGAMKLHKKYLKKAKKT
ncbi:rab GTPase-activating protein 22-like [Macadamia integrifolia]|uniref:rab GTPase-activating protein 22-like n=1 Tax=Macadamia integrifolia TaxID=60698 RepID=UPI001C4EC5E2|nr:rab GTPase-activating protein 22-like [Macadamia integrifolia]XP_042504222.1 rab GTPase-activating protein 22-like [Macadamia integrifolia]